jgi:hypothetical protein
VLRAASSPQAHNIPSYCSLQKPERLPFAVSISRAKHEVVVANRKVILNEIWWVYMGMSQAHAGYRLCHHVPPILSDFPQMVKLSWPRGRLGWTAMPRSETPPPIMMTSFERAMVDEAGWGINAEESEGEQQQICL